jgi:hypothetical protein
MSKHQVMSRTPWQAILTWATAIYLNTGILAIALAQHAAPALTDDDILEQNSESLVLLTTSGVLRATDGACGRGGEDAPETPGVGFFISSRGHILTAGHVVRRDEEWRCDEAGRPDGRKVQVSGYDKSNEKAQEITKETRNVRTSPYTDVALVKVKGSNRDPIDVVNTCEPRGEVVALVWRNPDSGPQPVSGRILPEVDQYTGGLVKFDVAAGQIQRGDSGSPIFNRSGQLVGILQGMGENARVGFFVPIADVADLLIAEWARSRQQTEIDITPCWDFITAVSLRFSGEGAGGDQDALLERAHEIASDIAEKLRKDGFRVPDPRQDENWGRDYEVRYFQTDDREKAERVAEATKTILEDLRSGGALKLSGQETNVRVIPKVEWYPPPPEDVELWLELELPE